MKLEITKKERVKMKRTILISIIMIMSLMGTSLLAQETASATVDAVVNAALTLANTATVDFGTIPATSTPIIDPKGASHTDVGTGVQVGTFTVTGNASSQITVTYDATSTLGNGTATMTFTPDLEGHATTQASAANVNSGSQVTLDGSGNFLFWLGGNLGTLSSQATGTYATDNATNGGGDWNLYIEYN
ncbi:MAG: DUF4402 domain-containing protein [Candidatus Marinimicrobia bacterium]|nr:DUF4402 domain-containing protein [Candidatus Neomarinimicrobiota bacterium]